MERTRIGMTVNTMNEESRGLRAASSSPRVAGLIERVPRRPLHPRTPYARELRCWDFACLPRVRCVDRSRLSRSRVVDRPHHPVVTLSSCLPAASLRSPGLREVRDSLSGFVRVLRAVRRRCGVAGCSPTD